jgi:HPt (histidine-containing phosphotransfer) domain-containing protein
MTTHGLKSSLANIGEPGLSTVALNLEQAGRNRDTAMMSNETGAFLDKLILLVNNLTPLEETKANAATDEDLPYLREKLNVMQEACSTYDKKTAKDIIADLRQKDWPGSTNDMLKTISEYLMQGYFEKAADIAGEIIKTVEQV